MHNTKIIVSDTSIRLTDVEIPSKDVADFFRARGAAIWEETLIEALQIGVFCLERAQTTQDTEFVKRQVETLLTKVERAVKEIPAATETALVAKIGCGDGQVLAPIDSLVKRISSTVTGRIEDVRKLLEEEIDPAKETTTLGNALRKLKDLLDPARNDSIQATLKSSLETVTSESGALTKAVEASAARAVKPLADEVERLARQIQAQEEVTAALEQTTAKGVRYKEQTVGRLQRWAAFADAEVHHVGGDNRPGDIVVDFISADSVEPALRVVVEVRDLSSRKGRKAISSDLSAAMSERNASAGLYVSKTPNGLAKEIGDWAEGKSTGGRWVACVDEHLVTAVRFLAAWERLSTLKAAAPEVDADSIETQLRQVRTSLDRVKTISRRVTEVKSGADGIQTEAEAIRDEVRAALSEIEDAIRRVTVALDAT